MVEPRLTPAEATSQIIGLINSKPTTPWPAEVKAIIDRVAKVPTATPALPDHVVAYHDRARELLRQCKVVGPMRHTEPNYEAEYQRSTELSNRVDEVGAVILETPAVTWGDLVGLASMPQLSCSKHFAQTGSNPLCSQKWQVLAIATCVGAGRVSINAALASKQARACVGCGG